MVLFYTINVSKGVNSINLTIKAMNNVREEKEKKKLRSIEVTINKEKKNLKSLSQNFYLSKTRCIHCDLCFLGDENKSVNQPEGK